MAPKDSARGIAMIAAYNQAIDQLKTDGTYNDIFLKHGITAPNPEDKEKADQ